MSIPDIILGDVTINVHRRLPSNAFTATPIKKSSVQRSQDGTLFTQKLYEKFTISIRGLAQELYPDLRFEYRKTDFIDLFSIVSRLEKLSGDGSTSVFTLSRRQRLDDSEALPLVFTPPGTTITSGLTLSNTATVGQIEFPSPPASGTNNIEVIYFPIINGSISDMNSNWNQFRGEETWDLTFEEA